jgi:glyoxylase-like metal-dependent hydrolase (beta-lactamase superfamily II)
MAEAANPPSYEVFAVKYAERDGVRGEHFLDPDPRADDPMSMDYFVWAARGGGRTFVIDTGFSADDAARRERRLLRTAAQGLASIDVDAATVEDVIITHLHYDHVGGIAQFPQARFHVQDREVAYATGRHMTHRALNHAFTPRHIADFVEGVHGGRAVFHDGIAELAPGLSVHHLGGHTDGLQVVRIWTRRGWLVLASDASHFYENVGAGRPFPILFDVGAVLDGYRRMRELAGSDELIVPGHDPQVLHRFPAIGRDLAGVAVRLD